MNVHRELTTRFGPEAAAAIAPLLGDPATGNPQQGGASKDRCIGAMQGLTAGDALGGPLEERSPDWIARHHGRIDGHTVPHPHTGTDTLMTLLSADALLADPVEHPARLASRLVAASVHGQGRALRHAKAALAAGEPWWRGGHPDSAGVAAPARCTAFGLLWADDPERAAFEAALSAAVTHRHPTAIAAAAAFAAAVALAATSPDGLCPGQLVTITDIAARYRQVPVRGQTLTDRLQILRAIHDGSRPEQPGDIVPGFVAHLGVPAALHFALTDGSPVDRLLACVNAGGDTDTVGAMTGALLGAGLGAGSFGDLDDVDGLSAAVDVAGRIADRRTTSPAPTPDPSAATATESAPAPAGDRPDDTPVNVSFLLDRSGSMSSLAVDVIGGFNAFVDNQRNETGDCTFTAVQFDNGDPFEIIHDAVPIADVPELTSAVYSARGMTPLLDAVGAMISHVDTRVAGGTGPEDQIVVVFTDGHENASHSWTRQRLFDTITDRKDKGWSFVFMGANQDSYKEAGRMGFDETNIQDYRGDSRGTRAAWGSIDRAVRGYRRASYNEKQLRREDLFQSLKEAETDHRTR